VQAIVVDAKLRGSDVGKALMDFAEAWARARRLGSVALSTRKKCRPSAHALATTSDLMRKAV